MRFIIFVFLLLAFGKVMAQSDQIFEPSPKERLLMEMANECINTHKYDRKQRLNFYPFNEASRIEIISFKKEYLIPVKKRKAIYADIHEHLELSTHQIDTLTDIFYNVNYDPTIKLDTRMIDEYKCYEPRNGILFFNSKGEAFEFIEICFDCHKTRSSSKKVIEGEYCNQKFDLLKGLFKSTGIKYVEDEKHAILSYDEILKMDTIDLLSALKSKLDDKRRNAELSDRLTPVESEMFFLLNARDIYGGNIVRSGLVDFYYNYSGEFPQQTAWALAEVGANKTLAVLNSSLIQWPLGKVPSTVAERRKELLVIANKAVPKWQVLEADLYFRDEKDPDGILTRKEDLDGLIFSYIMARKELLKD